MKDDNCRCDACLYDQAIGFPSVPLLIVSATTYQEVRMLLEKRGLNDAISEEGDIDLWKANISLVREPS